MTCAAALATLDILVKENMIDRVKALAPPDINSKNLCVSAPLRFI